VIYAAVVTILLGFRVVWYIRKRERTRSAIPQA
jgi:hypothetical protein